MNKKSPYLFRFLLFTITILIFLLITLILVKNNYDVDITVDETNLQKFNSIFLFDYSIYKPEFKEKEVVLRGIETLGKNSLGFDSKVLIWYGVGELAYYDDFAITIEKGDISNGSLNKFYLNITKSLKVSANYNTVTIPPKDCREYPQIDCGITTVLIFSGNTFIYATMRNINEDQDFKKLFEDILENGLYL